MVTEALGSPGETALRQLFVLKSTIGFLCLAALCATVRADVIVLKNGRRIVADSVRETNGKIEYTIGENTFAIPKTLVEKIDSGSPAKVPADVPAPAASDLPAVHEKIQAEEGLAGRIVHDGAVDPLVLKAIEDQGKAERSAVANFIAADFERRQNHLPLAAHYLQLALGFSPDNAILLENYAALLLEIGNPREAVPVAEYATRSSPQSADAFSMLGYAYYKIDRYRDAILAWRKSLALRPDGNIRKLMERVERESQAESGFRLQESGHFIVRYDGSRVPESLRIEILRVLEEHYTTLQNDLGVAPRNLVSVSLYTRESFFDVTQAPGWTAALNDGKIRVPVSGMTVLTPKLQRVLRHELAHSFIAQITGGHAPQWLNEGIAQMEEPATIAPVGSRLAELYASGHQIPLNMIEEPTYNYSSEEAAVVYAESLAAVEYIRVTYGIGDLTRIMRRLGEGESIEAAMRATIHSGYADLDRELTDYLRRTYRQ